MAPALAALLAAIVAAAIGYYIGQSNAPKAPTCPSCPSCKSFTDYIGGNDITSIKVAGKYSAGTVSSNPTLFTMRIQMADPKNTDEAFNMHYRLAEVYPGITHVEMYYSADTDGTQWVEGRYKGGTPALSTGGGRMYVATRAMYGASSSKFAGHPRY